MAHFFLKGNRKYTITFVLSGLFSLYEIFGVAYDITVLKGGYAPGDFFNGVFDYGSALRVLVIPLIILAVMVTTSVISLSFIRGNAIRNRASNISAVIMGVSFLFALFLSVYGLYLTFFVLYGVLVAEFIGLISWIFLLVALVAFIVLLRGYRRGRREAVAAGILGTDKKAATALFFSAILLLVLGSIMAVSVPSFQNEANRSPYSDQRGYDTAIRLQDPSYCIKYYGDNAGAYDCLERAHAQLNTVETISECQSMGTSQDDIYWKDNCFRGIAEVNLDTSTCNYLSSGEQAACVVQVNNDAYAKKNLCGPLFKGTYIPGAPECLDYVDSLHDVSKCNLLTRAQGPQEVIDACIVAAGGTPTVPKSAPSPVSNGPGNGTSHVGVTGGSGVMTSTSSVNFSSPTAGGNLIIGNSLIIQWAGPANTTYSLDIENAENNSVIGTVVGLTGSTDTATQHQYRWTVGNYTTIVGATSGVLPPGSYRIDAIYTKNSSEQVVLQSGVFTLSM